MDFSELIWDRESVRSYDPNRPVDDETLRKILEAGRLAPSAANRQPWEFWLLSSPEILEKVHPCYDREWFRNAPHILVVVGNKNECWVRASDHYSSLETDLTIAMDHLILAAENEGVASCWIAAFDPVLLRKALDLKAHQEVFAITPLGYPRSDYQKKHNKTRKPLEKIVRYL